MVEDVFYQQPCPVCGRRLRIGVMHLGRRVYCQHCGGGFVAADPSLTQEAAGDPPRCDRDAAVDRLIARAAVVLQQPAR